MRGGEEAPLYDAIRVEHVGQHAKAESTFELRSSTIAEKVEALDERPSGFHQVDKFAEAESDGIFWVLAAVWD